jgi:hypothetical protein
MFVTLTYTKHLSISNAKTGPKEVWFRQVSLCQLLTKYALLTDVKTRKCKCIS